MKPLCAGTLPRRMNQIAQTSEIRVQADSRWITEKPAPFDADRNCGHHGAEVNRHWQRQFLGHARISTDLAEFSIRSARARNAPLISP